MLTGHLDSLRLPSCCGRGGSLPLPMRHIMGSTLLHGFSRPTNNQLMRHHLSIPLSTRPVSHSRAAALGSMQMSSQSVDPMASKPGSSYTSGQVGTLSRRVSQAFESTSAHAWTAVTSLVLRVRRILSPSSQVFTVHSKEELDSFTQQEKLTVLMCKSSHCRPCKMFTRWGLRSSVHACVLQQIFHQTCQTSCCSTKHCLLVHKESLQLQCNCSLLARAMSLQATVGCADPEEAAGATLFRAIVR